MQRIRVSQNLFTKIANADDKWKVIVDDVLMDYPVKIHHLDRLVVEPKRIYVHDAGVNGHDGSFFIESTNNA